ncbi:MAG: 2-C-methyl-D-erythritol 4-phosphate cytidylyltransferase [Pseudomonadota bacterium]
MRYASPMADEPTLDALIVAAGRGNRAGGGVPKQYRTLGGTPVIARTVRALLSLPQVTALRVVIHPDDRAAYKAALAGVDDPRLRQPVFGGATRSESVRAGLAACEGTFVMIHDGARPLVPRDALERLWQALRGGGAGRGAFLALPVTDALWSAEAGEAQAPVSRDGLWQAQTPQAFALADIRAAHAAAAAMGGAAADPEAPPAPADDVETARAHGIPVAFVPGTTRNLKITRPEDFALAEALLETPMDIRTGHGFDVHAFGPGDGVTLNGVTIPFERGLKGHSDADVAMHVITDAVFGALCEGDIGQWFPPSEPAWKGAPSRIFLEKAVERAAARGFVISHVDCTIICEAPKIGPHADAMRAALSHIMGLDPGRISVKATTTERLGFAGRGEGIAAMATATLVAQ